MHRKEGGPLTGFIIPKEALQVLEAACEAGRQAWVGEWMGGWVGLDA